MAFDIGSITAKIELNIKDFLSDLEKAKKSASGLGNGLSKVGDAVTSFAKQASIASAVVGTGLSFFLKDASQEAANLEKAMITLDIIAGRFGESGKKAQDTAKNLAQELKIGVGATAEGLQNLLKSGLSLDKAADLMKRFTNEAMTGKSPTISLSQAVQNLSFAYATNNSALGNLSGISENFQDIIDRGRASLLKQGKAASEVTDEMAKYQGMIELTNLTMGSAERFAGSFIDTQAQLEQGILKLKIAIGQALNPVLNELIKLVLSSGLLEGLQKFGDLINQVANSEAMKSFGAWVKENKEIIITFFTGVAGGIAAVLVVAPLLLIALNPFILTFTAIALAVGFLYTAWQTNFLGIKDITMVVINAVIEFFNNTLMPFITTFVEWWKANWDLIKASLILAWDVIKGVVMVMWAVVYGIISTGLEILQGDWKGAWERIKQSLNIAWSGIQTIFNSIVSFVSNWGGTILSKLTQPFRDAWSTIEGLMNKIKDALDFTKRHSPSVLDIVESGVSKVNRALEGLRTDIILTPETAAMTVSNGGSSNRTVAVNLDMAGAFISDAYGAQRMAEIVGDQIIKKVQGQLRI